MQHNTGLGAQSTSLGAQSTSLGTQSTSLGAQFTNSKQTLISCTLTNGEIINLPVMKEYSVLTTDLPIVVKCEECGRPTDIDTVKVEVCISPKCTYAQCKKCQSGQTLNKHTTEHVVSYVLIKN